MKIYRKILLFAMLSILVVETAACSRQSAAEKEDAEQPQQLSTVSEEKTVSLTVYFSGEDVKWVSAVQEMCEEFMREYPYINLEISHTGEGVYTESLKVREAVNDFPDIFEIQNPDTFVKANKVGEMPAEITELVEEPIVIDGKDYAVPLYITTYGMIYNQVMFKKYGIEIPTTYSEFLEVCELLYKKGVTPIGLGGSKGDNASYWMSYFYQTEVAEYTPDWQARKLKELESFSGERELKMLESYKDLLSSKYILEDSINMNDNQLVRNFVDGNVAMIYAGPWLFPQIIDAYPEAAESDKDTLGDEVEEDTATCRLGWFFMPDAKGKQIVISKSGANWAISRECEEEPAKREAAITFFKYFFQKVHYQNLLQSMYAIPTTSEAVLYASPGVQQRLLVDYRYASKSKEYFGNTLTPDGFEVALWDVLNSIVTDVMSVESAAEKLDKTWDEMKE